MYAKVGIQYWNWDEGAEMDLKEKEVRRNGLD